MSISPALALHSFSSLEKKSGSSTTTSNNSSSSKASSSKQPSIRSNVSTNTGDSNSINDSLSPAGTSSTFADVPSRTSVVINYQNVNTDQLAILDDLGYVDDDDKGLLDYEAQHRKRHHIIEQIHQSEKAYCEALDLIMTQFYKPLMAGAKNNSFDLLGTRKPPCTEREAQCLFGNMKQIQVLQHQFLTSLEDRLRIWGPTQILTDIFQTWHQSIQVYVSYFENYRLAIATHEQLQKYQPFKKFIENAQNELTGVHQGKTLLSLLQVPAGCPSRYTQLVSKLYEATPPLHPDYTNLRSCRRQFISTTEKLKPTLQSMDNMDQVVLVHQALTGAPFTIKAHRRFILHQPPTRLEPRTIILFSDMIVLARPSTNTLTRKQSNKSTLQYKNHIDLDHIARIVVLPGDGEPAGAIQITVFDHDTDIAPTIHVLRTPQPHDWVKVITKAMEKRAHLRQQNNRKEQHPLPVTSFMTPIQLWR
ncbi:hypothetical protein O0I10_002705 [Lichtheimia ornata]|uniref:DH domain-containing protein n=1 Tax=Lichtheimia ornata TaxID=688661 RepID=A0AAD7V9B9_9FUNG|nr:uncharacterized protein O0I10_002705 [Lichtheimia ornata]KAJ8661439.1 hypothetical protein O0I10_002705 [Lichtheimia ornata]